MSPFSADENLTRWITAIRRHIHAFPELSFQEIETSKYICARLEELGISFIGEIAKTGITADLGKSDGKPACIALRADMDALPIEEKTGLPFSSKNQGVMHACGHDGHIAILLGAASLLSKIDLPGKVRLIFQPAEESGGGAGKMIQAGVLEGVRAIVSGHIDRHFKVGQIAVQPGIICAYTDEFQIEINGPGGHAGKPHETIDTVVIACSLVASLQSLVSREIDPVYPSVLSVGKIRGGSAPNVIAEKTMLEGTIRCTDESVRQQMIHGMTRICRGIHTMYGAEIAIRFTEGYPPVVNDEEVSGTARLAARKIVGEHGVLKLPHPSMGGEDFSFFLKEVPGCFVRLGAMKEGVNAAAHSSQFDFDERVLALGACFMAQAALDYLLTC